VKQNSYKWITKVLITCELCGTDNWCTFGELSIYCAECCSLLMRGERHNDFPVAHRDAKERAVAWVLKNKEQVIEHES